ncbi:DNA primase [Buchnera aphidicola (Pemphigus obesinymphae)]|uniref:DNA primase n=1 Tax=Buchnera aphidicola TaxID=9 RepID=UPI002237706A|nr:DNA primase [Buchnera aphidicola]MCW5196535.1 DNA primase [Buchnera aphidicola (Pemphigus obesinymphae)]
MTGKIPKVFIDELLIKTNIIDLINSRIPLKKKGQNYHAKCPFHNEKTPSFTVNDKKQFYYCFGCNAHGNVIDFLMNYEHLTFIESIETLSILNRLTIPYNIGYKKNKNEYNKRNELYCLLKTISDIYKKNIVNDNTNEAYLYLKKRGINGKMINDFSIGFAPKEWNNMSNKIILNQKNRNTLIDSGILMLNKQGYPYDRFRGRIIFPIKDNYGRISGFGARNLDNKKPKYINSPETNIFHKSRQLYGLYEIKKKYPKPDKLLIVEGYIDVIMLTQFKINYAVASLGTSITSEHIQLLFRTTNNIIYCYDGDNSGKEAAWRTLKKSLPYIQDGKSIKFIFLPQDEDPDTIVRKEGKKAFENRINQATNLSKFLFHKLLKNINLSSIEGRSYLSAIAVPLIKLIPGGTMRIYLKQILAHKLGIPDLNQLEQLFIKNKKKIENYSIKPIKQNRMRILISLLIQNPYLAKNVPSVEQLNNLKIKGLTLFLELTEMCKNNPKTNTGQILEAYRNTDIISVLYKLAKWDHMIIEKETKNVFLDLLSGLYNKILEIRQELLINKERKKGLNNTEKKELWSINKKLAGI